MLLYKSIRSRGINVYLWMKYTVQNLMSKNAIKDKAEVVALIKSFAPVATDAELIRVGPDMDGGYLVPDAFEGIKVCFSPGVGMYSGFEKELADRGMDVYMADGSVEKPQIEHPKFHFIKKFIGKETGGNVISMPDWIRENTTEAQDEMLLQMDIEGHEYAALEAMSQELLSRFRIIIIELHGLFKFWEPDFHKTMVALRDKLLKDHVTVHLHPNNCCGVFKYQGVGIPRALEITLIKKDYVETKGFAKEFPHPLDQDNTALGHIKLPKDWIRV